MIRHDAPSIPEIFTLCPHLVTLSVSGLDLEPLVEQGHPTLQNWLLGDPWSYHNETANEFERIERESGRFDWSTAEGVGHRLTDDDKEAVRQVLAADKVSKHRHFARARLPLYLELTLALNISPLGRTGKVPVARAGAAVEPVV